MKEEEEKNVEEKKKKEEEEEKKREEEERKIEEERKVEEKEEERKMEEKKVEAKKKKEKNKREDDKKEGEEKKRKREDERKRKEQNKKTDFGDKPKILTYSLKRRMKKKHQSEQLDLYHKYIVAPVMTVGMCIQLTATHHELAGIVGEFIFSEVRDDKKKKFRLFYSIINTENIHQHLVVIDMIPKRITNARKWHKILGAMFHMLFLRLLKATAVDLISCVNLGVNPAN
ncbi:hypothetical protein COCNU_scaffold001383G000010 [Cocos nucifera]|nr:hypothetical protein [Cocos nucifera]